MKIDRYRLRGIINLYDYNMDIVNPIFEKDGLFYFQKIKNNKIEDFELITNINLLEKIKIFEKGISNNLMNKYCGVGDNAFYAFQTDIDDVYVSTLPGFLSFLKSIKTFEKALDLSIKSFILQNDKPKEKIKTTLK